MSTLDQIRRGLGRAWDSLAEGWLQLQERASHALTRFNPVHRGELQSAEEQVALAGSRWGLLAAEVQESADSVIVRLEAPGMERDDFDIAVDDGRVLVVRGEKQVRREDRQGRFHVMECAYGSFERAIVLPAEVDDTKAKAIYRRGVLKVTLPKSRNAIRRRIPIQHN